jgi:hypothetical protein
MPLQTSRGLFEIRFVSALALCSSVAVVGLSSVTAESVTEHIVSIRANGSVTTESKSRSPNFNDNLQSESKFNQKTSKNDDRLPSDLYYPSAIDTDSKTKPAELPNRGERRRGVEVSEANFSGLGDSASFAYTNTEVSNGVDFTHTLPVNLHNGNVSFELNRTRSNLIEPPFDSLDIEASDRTYELTYRQPLVQTLKTEIAFGIGGGRRESDTSLLREDFPLSTGSDSRVKLAFQP